MTRATPLGLAAKDARLILEASDGKLELAVAQQVERRFREGSRPGTEVSTWPPCIALSASPRSRGRPEPATYDWPSGRVAQWESARFTRERSLVRNQPRPSRPAVQTAASRYFLTLTFTVSETAVSHSGVSATCARYTKVFLTFFLVEKLPPASV
jgi:hypothetical protein